MEYGQRHFHLIERPEILAEVKEAERESRRRAAALALQGVEQIKGLDQSGLDPADTAPLNAARLLAVDQAFKPPIAQLPIGATTYDSDLDSIVDAAKDEGYPRWDITTHHEVQLPNGPRYRTLTIKHVTGYEESCRFILEGTTAGGTTLWRRIQ